LHRPPVLATGIWRLAAWSHPGLACFHGLDNGRSSVWLPRALRRAL